MKLISTIEEIQEYVPVSYTSTIDRIKPFIGSAERTYLQTVIGRQQFQILVDAYTDANKNISQIADPEIREAVVLAQRIITNLGYLTGLPVLAVNFTDSGISVTSNTDIKQAFKWQVDEVKASIQELGFTAIEDLIIFMEEDAPDKFPEYLNSAEYLKHQQYLITSASDFSESLNINNSRYIFKMLSYLMKRVEDQSVKKLYGESFFNGLKENDLEGKSLKLVNDYIMPGIALLTGAKAIVERVITFRNGVASVNIEGNYNTEKNNTAATIQQTTNACEQLITDGSAFLQDGLQFVLDNILDFPTYQVQAPRRRRTITNIKENGVYAA